VAQAEKVRCSRLTLRIQSLIDDLGGKAKPLKAPKKEKKDMDEEEVAFKEKQKAGVLLKNRYNTKLLIKYS